MDQCTFKTKGKPMYGVKQTRQCLRKAVRDGLCRMHHPEEIKLREEAENRRSEEFMGSLKREELGTDEEWLDNLTEALTDHLQ